MVSLCIGIVSCRNDLNTNSKRNAEWREHRLMNIDQLVSHGVQGDVPKISHK